MICRPASELPLDDCIGAIANFCDCRIWREKNQTGEARYVFFGLRSDVEVAHYLTDLIDNAVRSGLGRYKNSAGYRRFRHQDRHVANSSFTLGMVASIADKLMANEVGAQCGEFGHRARSRRPENIRRRCGTGEARFDAANGAQHIANGVANGL